MRFIIFILIICMSCGRVRELPSPNYAKSGQNINQMNIRFDGLYNVKDTILEAEGFKSIVPIVVCENQKIFRDVGVSKTYNLYNCDWYKTIKKEEIGTFNIVGNVIYAYLPTLIVVRGMRHEIYFANFKGIIKNRDTIVDWKMIDPYPKIMREFEFKLPDNQRLLMPQTMYFVKTDAVKCLNPM